MELQDYSSACECSLLPQFGGFSCLECILEIGTEFRGISANQAKGLLPVVTGNSVIVFNTVQGWRAHRMQVEGELRPTARKKYKESLV